TRVTISLVILPAPLISPLFPYTTLFRSDISAIKGGTPVPRQLVDGGYFDNSGATTLAELVLLARDHVPGCSGPSGLGSETCPVRSEEHTSELQSLRHLVCRLLLEKKNIQ